MQDMCQGSPGFKQIRGVLNWKMDQNLILLINSAILVIRYVQEGETKGTYL